MLSLTKFHAAYGLAQYDLDPEKRSIINPPADSLLHVIAGPGTGKTTALVARILKLLYVDQTPPTGIVATTFTKKAANELRSRLLEVGFPLAEEILKLRLTDTERTWVEAVDINQVWTGTIDGLCQELLTMHRPAGEDLPVITDQFVTDTLMLTEGVFGDRRHYSASLRNLLADATGRRNQNVPSMRASLSAVADRRHHDLLDMKAYARTGPRADRKGRRRLIEALTAYDSALADKSLVDYAGIERETLRRLQAGLLDNYLQGLSVLLVDEYQDTNLLQEQIYLELAKGSGCSTTVVGDDDQSLYRFRGATVELFTDYPMRAKSFLGRLPTTEFLKTNHRSTKAIVEFVNAFASNDAAYQSARSDRKPRLRPKSPEAGMPILAMFRDDAETLADDLADFLLKVFRGSGARIKGHGTIKSGRAGDIGDAALLTYSPKEDQPQRLVPQLRGKLADVGMGLFNPRGHQTVDVAAVQNLVGLVLEALDPSEQLQSTEWQSDRTRARLTAWRLQARALQAHDADLRREIRRWQRRESSANWPRRTPFLELLYLCTQRLPGVLDDPEQQLYVEMIARQVNAAEQVGNFRGNVLLNRDGETRAGNPRGDRSVKELLHNVILPIAEGDVGLNEELIDSFPHDRLAVLSIHQAKGLEFPLVIVDVGSRFKTNHHTQARQRFPSQGDDPHRMEDHFRPSSPLGVPERDQLDRAFDDLIRQYFVAFSRPQDVLLLVANRNAQPSGTIPNIALGWDRNRNSRWAKNPPYVEV